jgi:hypothetical protein
MKPQVLFLLVDYNSSNLYSNVLDSVVSPDSTENADHGGSVLKCHLTGHYLAIILLSVLVDAERDLVNL